MEILHNVNLKHKNTFHINGMTNNYYIPKEEKDLYELSKIIKNKKYYVLSNGSNILINDKLRYENIIYMGKIDDTFEQKDNDLFYIGCSLKIQQVINNLNQLGYGGIEEMYSIPAMFGGIVCMNAGIGNKKNPKFTISDFIIKVKVYNMLIDKIEWIDKNKCDFYHRHSIFKNGNYLIIGAICKFKKQKIEVSKNRIKKRLKETRTNHEMGKGTFGTCFSEVNNKLLRIVAIIYKKKGKVHFGKKNLNWLVNDGNGTYEDVIFLINKVKKIHKLFHKEIRCEVIIWK